MAAFEVGLRKVYLRDHNFPSGFYTCRMIFLCRIQRTRHIENLSVRRRFGIEPLKTDSVPKTLLEDLVNSLTRIVVTLD